MTTQNKVMITTVTVKRNDDIIEKIIKRVELAQQYYQQLIAEAM